MMTRIVFTTAVAAIAVGCSSSSASPAPTPGSIAGSCPAEGIYSSTFDVVTQNSSCSPATPNGSPGPQYSVSINDQAWDVRVAGTSATIDSFDASTCTMKGTWKIFGGTSCTFEGDFEIVFDAHGFTATEVRTSCVESTPNTCIQDVKLTATRN